MTSVIVILVGVAAVALLAWREHRAERKETLAAARMMASVTNLSFDMKIAAWRHYFSGRAK